MLGAAGAEVCPLVAGVCVVVSVFFLQPTNRINKQRPVTSIGNKNFFCNVACIIVTFLRTRYKSSIQWCWGTRRQRHSLRSCLRLFILPYSRGLQLLFCT